MMSASLNSSPSKFRPNALLYNQKALQLKQTRHQNNYNTDKSVQMCIDTTPTSYDEEVYAPVHVVTAGSFGYPKSQKASVSRQLFNEEL